MAETFEQAYKRAGRYTLVGEDRMRVLWDTVQQCAHLADHIVEVGVHRGGSAVVLQAAMPEHQLILFDTFSGHPSVAESDEVELHAAGRFSDTSVEQVRELVGRDPFIIAGTFPASLLRLGPLPPLAFVHCDVDLYQSTRDVLERCWPALVEGGALVCDDYGFDDCPGAKRAVEEFIVGRSDVQIERLETRQARLWKAA